MVNVISVMGDDPEPLLVDNLKLPAALDQDLPLRMMLKAGSVDSGKDGNLVTVVQTGDTADTSHNSPVIVTVSGSTPANSQQQHAVDTEMEILAHL